MAWQPCLSCGSRFDGEAQNLYLSHFVGDQRERYRFVVCPGCSDELLADWRNRALFDPGTGQWEWHEPTTDAVPRLAPLEPRERPSKPRPGR